jgi:uncharacterized membrane protein
MKSNDWSLLRRYMIAGLLVWLPIWVTLLVISFVVDILDTSLQLLPHKYQPDYLLGFHLPGFGIILSIVIVLVTGIIANNVFGNKLVALAESLVNRIPLVRSVYTSVKQVSETLFAKDGQSFRKVVLVEYPRKGMWSIAFQTGNSTPVINGLIKESCITIFIPTTPNPTSGFLMLVPEKDVINLDMPVDVALKMVISLGVMQPNGKVVTEQ